VYVDAPVTVRLLEPVAARALGAGPGTALLVRPDGVRAGVAQPASAWAEPAQLFSAPDTNTNQIVATWLDVASP
jgi:hypothetical protein